jgi:hypothetical protein
MKTIMLVAIRTIARLSFYTNGIDKRVAAVTFSRVELNGYISPNHIRHRLLGFEFPSHGMIDAIQKRKGTRRSGMDRGKSIRKGAWVRLDPIRST